MNARCSAPPSHILFLLHASLSAAELLYSRRLEIDIETCFLLGAGAKPLEHPPSPGRKLSKRLGGNIVGCKGKTFHGISSGFPIVVT